MNFQKINWPNEKSFAFTIIDETDYGTTENLTSIYKLLLERKIKITKTVWLYHTRDHFTGDSLEDKSYRDFILHLNKNGVEIALHNVGSGFFSYQEKKNAMNLFKKYLGYFPKILVNHSNMDNIYWGHKRFIFPFNFFYKVFQRRQFYGDDAKSEHFWGDIVKEHIDYIPNFSFKNNFTSFFDDRMPYIINRKTKYSNYWFSTTLVKTIEDFEYFTSKEFVDLLEKKNAFVILHVCFGKLNIKEMEMLKKQIKHLSERNGWFVTVSELLDFLRQQQTQRILKYKDELILTLRWLFNR